MNVSGLSSATLCPSILISASCPLNFERQEPPWRRASSSTTIQPTLCRFPAYSRPGLPSPATSRSSEVPCLRGQSRMTPLTFGRAGLAALAGAGFGSALGGGFGGRFLALRHFALGLLAFDGLRLLFAQRRRDGCEDGLLEVVEQR